MAAALTGEPTPARRRRHWLIWLVVLWLAPSVALAALLGWSAQRERSFQPPIVADPLPTPNGYDLLVRAAAAMEAHMQGPPPRFDAYLAANADVFETIDRALDLRIIVPAAERDSLGSSPVATRLGALDSLLAARARGCAGSGDHRGATEAHWRRARLGLAVCRGRNLAVADAGLRHAGLAAADLANEVGALDAKSAAPWPARLERLLAEAPTPRAIFVRCAPVQAGLELTGPGLLAQARYLGAPPPRVRYEQRLAWLYDLATEMDKPLTAWRRPPTPPGDATAEPFCWVHLARAQAMVTHLAALRVGLVGSALSAYHAEHRRWPESLAPLVPRYLRELPADPCDGQPLRYRLSDEQPRCWSVGGDGRDDGGRSADPFAPPDMAVGDVVWPPQRRQAES